MAQRRSQQYAVDGIAGLLLGGFIGLFLGGYVANLLQLTGPFHGVFSVRFGTVSGAVAGMIASLFADRSGRAKVVTIAAIAGAVACLPLPSLDIWPEHFVKDVASLSLAEVFGVGLAYGIIAALALSQLNRSRFRTQSTDKLSR